MANRRGTGRTGESVVVAICMVPVHLAEGLALFFAMTWQDVKSYWPERRRYREIARATGIDRGRVLKSSFKSNGFGWSLHIISLWPGSWEDVLARVEAGIEAFGYRESYPDPRSGSPPKRIDYSRRIVLDDDRSGFMPNLTVVIFTPGQTITGTRTVVPQGQTGLRLGLLQRGPGWLRPAQRAAARRSGPCVPARRAVCLPV